METDAVAVSTEICGSVGALVERDVMAVGAVDSKTTLRLGGMLVTISPVRARRRTSRCGARATASPRTTMADCFLLNLDLNTLRC